MTQPEFTYIDRTLLADTIATLSRSPTAADYDLAYFLKEYKTIRHGGSFEVIGAVLQEAKATGLRTYTRDSAPERAGPFRR
jgi:hypothetical protein